MKSKIFLLVIFACLFSLINCQAIQITKCEDLKLIETGRTDVAYELANDIDCSQVYDYLPIYNNSLPFKGYFDGKGFSIYSLYVNVPQTYPYAGLFAKCESAYVANCYLKNYTLIAYNTSNVGAYCGEASNCTISNCHLDGYQDTTNKVYGYYKVGGICGHLNNTYDDTYYSSVTNCTVYNSHVYGYESVGGVAGLCDLKTNVSFCTNKGHAQDYYTVVVNGTTQVGGLVGSCRKCKLWNSGIVQGTVYGSYDQIGSCVGYCGNGWMQSIYAKQYTYVNCTYAGRECAAGGVVGRYNITEPNAYEYSYIYSKSVVKGNGYTGGIAGYLYAPTASNITYKECYTSCYIVPANQTEKSYGNIFGYVYLDPNSTLYYDKVYYNNENSAYGDVGEVNDPTKYPYGTALNYTCENLYLQVNSTYDPLYYGGDNLIYEYGYQYGVQNCTPIILPPYAYPVTEAPTAAPTPYQ